MKLIQYGRWSIGKVLFYPVAFVLAWVVVDNYKKRQAGKVPDSWHWADVLLGSKGFMVIVK